MLIARQRPANGRETTRRPFKAGARVRSPNVFFLPLAQTAVFFRLLLVCVPAGPSFSFFATTWLSPTCTLPRQTLKCMFATYICVFFPSNTCLLDNHCPYSARGMVLSRGLLTLLLGHINNTWDCVSPLFDRLRSIVALFTAVPQKLRNVSTVNLRQNQGNALKTFVRTEQSETRWNGREAY